MNAQEWYREVKKHDGGMVAFCCDQLAAKDGLIGKLQDELRQSAAVEIELAASRGDLARQLVESNTVRARQAMRIVNQRNTIESLQRALDTAREDHVKTLKKLDVAENRVVLDRAINLLAGKSPLARFQDELIFGADFAKGESWTSSGKTLLDLLYPLYVIKPSATAKIQSLSMNCVVSAADSAGHKDEPSWRQRESAAESEARETESLAHRIEELERRTDRHRAVGDRLVDATLGKSRMVLKVPLIDQIEKLRVGGEMMALAGASSAAIAVQHERRLGALESNIVGVRKAAEGDRIEICEKWLNTERGLAQLAKRINAAGIPPLDPAGA